MKRFIPFLIQATEEAAKASAKVAGCGDRMLADRCAVDAMRSSLSKAPFLGTVVIGEGERDEAPMLYIGERVGASDGCPVDIALDPLEGTNLCADYASGSMSVIACAPKGCFLHAPDVYMRKIAVGPGFPKGIVSLKYSIEDNLNHLAQFKNIPISDLVVILLNRSRHDELVSVIRKLGAKIKLISDGDIAAILEVILKGDGDLYIGTGGAPEGVLAASAVRACAGQMEGQLVFFDKDQQERARDMGVIDLDNIYSSDELVKSDSAIFVATGVTDGNLLCGVKNNYKDSHSIIVSKNEIQYFKKSIL